MIPALCTFCYWTLRLPHSSKLSPGKSRLCLKKTPYIPQVLQITDSFILSARLTQSQLSSTTWRVTSLSNMRLELRTTPVEPLTLFARVATCHRNPLTSSPSASLTIVYCDDRRIFTVRHRCTTHPPVESGGRSTPSLPDHDDCFSKVDVD